MDSTDNDAFLMNVDEPSVAINDFDLNPEEQQRPQLKYETPQVGTHFETAFDAFAPYVNSHVNSSANSSPDGNPATLQRLQVCGPRDGMNAGFTASPESSAPADSSSESSRGHKRKSSSRSSHSRSDNLQKHTTSSSVPPHAIPAQPFNFRAAANPGGDNSLESSNLAMENDFDFNGAAESPTSTFSVQNAFNGPRHIVMPVRESPSAPPRMMPYPPSITDTRDTSPINPTSLIRDMRDFSFANDVGVNPVILDNYNSVFDSQLPHSQLNSPQFFQERSPSFGAQSSAYSPLAAAPVPSPSYKLVVHPTVDKSRVETQIPIKISMSSLPPGVTKLHLPAHTIAKPKLMANPPHERVEDTLELFTMLVCTSAMLDPVKRQRALARATVSSGPKLKREVARRSSDGETAGSNANDEDLPTNGGEVNICDGCIQRERKRSARKKSKKPEEDEAWQKDEAKRVIVFNTSEVKDWLLPSEATGAGSKSRDSSPSQDNNEPELPETARSIELPMRIACYCRHHNEKGGFRVIFTIRDSQDKVVAQAMSESIMITDDHKTHGPINVGPQAANIDPTQPHLFMGHPMSEFNYPLSRNAHSTPDLQALQRGYPSQLPFASMQPFGFHQGIQQQPQHPQQSSNATSGTMTPTNRSRPASPTVPNGPVHKKRKSSSTRAIPPSLAMTSMTATAPASAIDSAGLPPAPNSAASPTAPAPYGSVMYHPPTMPPNAMPLRSQPNSARPSRSGSPVGPPQAPSQQLHGPTFAQPNAPSVGAHAHPSPAHQFRGAPPVFIHQVTPDEGPKSGGIMVGIFGSGFDRNMEIMFGDRQAQVTTFWAEGAMMALLPPNDKPGPVPVTFKHEYEAMLRGLSVPQRQPVMFTYRDDDELQILKLAVLAFGRKQQGREPQDVMEYARWTANSTASQQPMNSNPHMASFQLRAVLHTMLASGSADTETAILERMIDLDQAPFRASFNSQAPNGQTMLHLAAALGYRRLTDALLARGAEPNLRDKNGMSPLHMAALNGHGTIIRRLRAGGANVNLRTLMGQRPADLTRKRSILEAILSGHYDRPRRLNVYHRTQSAGSLSATYQSAENNETLRSLWEPSSVDSSSIGSSDEDDIESSPTLQPKKPITVPAIRFHAVSRENTDELPRIIEAPSLTDQAALLGPMLTMWRDNLNVHIQHFQQSVQWAMPNLPNLQLPTVPPLPNMPDYQQYPMVRRISSLVPQRVSSPEIPRARTPEPRANDSKWFNMFGGIYSGSSSPPAYEEIFPDNYQQDRTLKATSARAAAADAMMNRKCEAVFDNETVSSSTSMTPTVVAKKPEVKRLRNDRKLFFIWIPLLILVFGLMLREQAPRLAHGAKLVGEFVRGEAVFAL